MSRSRAISALTQHRAHDVRHLIQRWRQAVRGTGFTLRQLGKKDGFPLIQVSNRPPTYSDDGGLYISTGIHGDEPAAPWGLLEWFERGLYAKLSHRPIVLFPCLNPLGVVENHRVDGKGRDLNRIFDRSRLSPIKEVRSAVAKHRFQLAICLHEDYDAQGAYVYDLNRCGDLSSGESLLREATTSRIPVDGRQRIDGRKAINGVLFRRRLDMRNVPGLPEAVFLFLEGHADRTLTFETPSEFNLLDRIEVQRRFLEAAVRWCRRQGR